MNKVLILVLFLLGLCISSFAQETYKIGETEYYYNKTYATTGLPMVKRSSANKAKFLRQKGLSSTPYGYEIDHIIPLCEGGTDAPSNMQLLTKEQHAWKTAKERTHRAHTASPDPSYNSSANSYATPSHHTETRAIHTGPRGGKYYINSHGNKTYVRRKQ